MLQNENPVLSKLQLSNFFAIGRDIIKYLSYSIGICLTNADLRYTN
jgi:hypothetical protein